mmetsp:Transcript_26779/g.75192  ORF Transcript_26779/g.75192 Transcript_26779/m.75192 type:complete len:254 (+) Transcript_26779:628-1389(+)
MYGRCGAGGRGREGVPVGRPGWVVGTPGGGTKAPGATAEVVGRKPGRAGVGWAVGFGGGGCTDEEACGATGSPVAGRRKPPGGAVGRPCACGSRLRALCSQLRTCPACTLVPLEISQVCAALMARSSSVYCREAMARWSCSIIWELGVPLPLVDAPEPGALLSASWRLFAVSRRSRAKPPPAAVDPSPSSSSSLEACSLSCADWFRLSPALEPACRGAVPSWLPGVRGTLSFLAASPPASTVAGWAPSSGRWS